MNDTSSITQNEHQRLDRPIVESSVTIPSSQLVSEENILSAAETSEIINKARNIALKLEPQLKRQKRNHALLIFDRDAFNDKANELAHDEVTKMYPSTPHYKEYVKLHQDTFTKECYRLLQENGILDEIATEKQRQLRTWALEDKEKQKQSPELSHHVAHLAVLRAAQVEGYTLAEACEHVAKLAEHTKLYQKYYDSGSNEEVLWPGQDSF